MTHETIKADPPPNLLYDLREAARVERWERRAATWAAAGRVYVFAGATAGLAALVLEFMR